MDPLKKRRRSEILFVDDSPAHARIAIEALGQGRGQLRIRVATNGADALDRVMRRAPYEASPYPDLVLLDLELPQVGGLDVLGQMKERDELRSIPVVVLTRSTDPQTLAECYRRGANSVVACPIELEQLAAVYRKVVDYWTTVHRAPQDANE